MPNSDVISFDRGQKTTHNVVFMRINRRIYEDQFSFSPKTLVNFSVLKMSTPSSHLHTVPYSLHW